MVTPIPPPPTHTHTHTPPSDLYKSNCCQLEQPRWRDGERRARQRKKQEKEREREGGEGANKRGKDKESCKNMKHERLLMDGWYCFPLLKYVLNHFLRMLPSFHSPGILSNLLFPNSLQVSALSCAGRAEMLVFVLTSYVFFMDLLQEFITSLLSHVCVAQVEPIGL